MIIAIDGPAGAGKSTTARAVAERFGFAYIDTGAMYRAVALACVENGLDVPDDAEQICELAHALPITLRENGRRVFIDQRDVSEMIRTPQISEQASQVAAIPGVRAAIVEQQRRAAGCGEREQGGAVLEGRDIQTVVFPNAEVKIFLTASTETRAARRVLEWQAKGQHVKTEETVRDIAVRDNRDSTRATSPLRAAPDAIVLATDDLTPQQVAERIAQIIEAKRGAMGTMIE